MKKLWSVKVNNWGWDSPKTLYAESRSAAEQIAGNFSDANAARLLASADDWWDSL